MAGGIEFTKMQGVGNDFVLVDGSRYRDVDWARFAIEVCPRRTSVGADGVLVVDRSDTADLSMRMYNPDGTPDVCGNGMRCAARYWSDHGGGGGAHSLTIETRAGIRTAVSEGEGRDWTVDMGVPRFSPADIPMRVDSERVVDFPLEAAGRTIAATALSTGTTHTVLFVDDLPADEEFAAVSSALEHHPLFPERTSVMWTRVAEPSRLELRIWERGAGETWGCGTGACAAAAAAMVRGEARGRVRVESKGGVLLVEWIEGGPITLSGPADYVYSGVWPGP